MKKTQRTVAVRLLCAMQHAVQARDVLVEVRDHRKRNRHLEMLLDIAQPGDVAVDAIDRVAEQARRSSFPNRCARLANSTNSVVHTGVKSAGCENRDHPAPGLPLRELDCGPWVVVA